MWHCHWFKASIFASRTSNVGFILFSTRNCDISPCGTKLSASCVIITASPSRSCVARPAGPTLSVHLKYFLSGWKYFYPGQNIFTGSVLCCVRVLIRVANARVSNMSADFHSLHSAAGQNTEHRTAIQIVFSAGWGATCILTFHCFYLTVSCI